MRLGISLPTRRADFGPPSAAEVMESARMAERLGFEGIWVGDAIARVSWPYPDPLGWLAVAAAGTERVELGTSVLQVPLRHTAELAQRFMTLHALSGGRFTAGVGSGSTRGDFEANGVAYEDRFRLLASALPELRKLCRGEGGLTPWTGDEAGPRMLIGSWHSGRWVERAARDYDGWIASAFATSFRELREGIQRYRDFGGKRALVSTITVNLRGASSAFDENERFTLECGPTEAAERLARLAELGYDDALLVRPNYSPEDLPGEDLAAIRALLPRSGD